MALKKIFWLLLFMLVAARAAAQNLDPYVPEVYGDPSNEQVIAWDASQTRFEPFSISTLIELEDLLTPTDDSVPVANGTIWEVKTIADCDASTNALNYDTTANAWSCRVFDDLADFETATDDGVPVGNGTTFATAVIPTCSAASSALNYTIASNSFSCRTFDGVEDFETATDDALIVGNGTTFDTKVVADCDSAGRALNYDVSTNAFSCRTLDWTTDIVEGTATAVATFDVGVAKASVTTLDLLSNYLTDMAANFAVTDGDIMFGSSGIWDDIPIATATESNVAIGNLSDVTIAGLTAGDALMVVSGALQDFPLLAFDTDTDATFTSISSTTPADITGLLTTLSNLTGRELVIVWAQIPMSAAAAGECQLQIIQDLDGVDTGALTEGWYACIAADQCGTDGHTDTVTLVSAFAPAAGTTANYTVEWNGDGGNNCYQDDAYMLAVAFLDQ